MGTTIVMRDLVAVAAGGMLGAVLRYLVTGWTQALSRTTSFPIGTLVVNIVGCLVIGVLAGWTRDLEAFSATTRAFLLLGLLGAFTTFSTFGYETVAMLQDGRHLTAFTNVATQVMGGLAAVWLGYALATVGR